MNSKNPLVVPIYCGVALLAVIAAILGYRQWTLAAIREDVKAALPMVDIDGKPTEVNIEPLNVTMDKALDQIQRDQEAKITERRKLHPDTPEDIENDELDRKSLEIMRPAKRKP